LKEKYARGKELGPIVQECRQKISGITSKIEQLRKENAMRGMVDENGEIKETPEMTSLYHQLG